MTTAYRGIEHIGRKWEKGLDPLFKKKVVLSTLKRNLNNLNFTNEFYP